MTFVHFCSVGFWAAFSGIPEKLLVAYETYFLGHGLSKYYRRNIL